MSDLTKLQQQYRADWAAKPVTRGELFSILHTVRGALLQGLSAYVSRIPSGTIDPAAQELMDRYTEMDKAIKGLVFDDSQDG